MFPKAHARRTRREKIKIKICKSESEWSGNLPLLFRCQCAEIGCCPKPFLRSGHTQVLASLLTSAWRGNVRRAFLCGSGPLNKIDPFINFFFKVNIHPPAHTIQSKNPSISPVAGDLSLFVFVEMRCLAVNQLYKLEVFCFFGNLKFENTLN